MGDKKIMVTRPFLPELKEYIPYLEQIWENKILTNNGLFHQELEKKLSEYLEVPYISLFSNGTLALITAIQALKLSGEVITTPFSFVATTHALWWNNIKPVFADIELDTFTLSPSKIEAAITPGTTAILPVHVYGNPCKVDEIDGIAKKYGLKVLYDAAHTFGARYKGKSICSYGDMSILSFHATKIFNTFEGGAIISHDEETYKRVNDLKNFGFRSETEVVYPGINAKMNEPQAAMGLLQLKYTDKLIEERRKISDYYKSKLKGIAGIYYLSELKDVSPNYAYFPVLVDKQKYGISRDQLYDKLKDKNIYARRYFYPLISHFSTYSGLVSAKPDNLPVATKLADMVICLPMYNGLAEEDIDKIVNIIK